jgi:hypothetical protein
MNWEFNFKLKPLKTFTNTTLTLSIMSGVIMMAAYKDLSNLHIISSVWPLMASIVMTTACKRKQMLYLT